MKDKRLVVVSGPSGVGKGPIIEWTKKLYIPDLCQVKVRKTKTERHVGTEDDLGFRGISGNTYEFDCRGVLQVIELNELDGAIESCNAVLLETYYRAFDFLRKRYESSVDFASTFISPLDKEELKDLDKQNRLEDYLPDLMLNSLIRRANRDGKAFTHSLLRELEKRAEDSCREIMFAHNYRFVIPNYCYESDPRWRYPILIGEPRKVVRSMADVIQTGNSDYVDNGSDYSFLEKRMRRYLLGWEDWIDNQSHSREISVEDGKDPYKEAREFLDSTAGPGKGKYLIEFLGKIKEGENT